MDWQPIETAPKDGSLVLTWGDCRAQYAVAYWDEYDNEWYSDFNQKGNISLIYATHWMPLPPEPVVSEQKEEPADENETHETLGGVDHWQ